MIRNIIFDWSGTLVDDLPAVVEATNYVLTQAGRPEMTLDEFRAEFRLPFTLFYDKHVPDMSLTPVGTVVSRPVCRGAGFGVCVAACSRVPAVLSRAARLTRSS